MIWSTPRTNVQGLRFDANEVLDFAVFGRHQEVVDAAARYRAFRDDVLAEADWGLAVLHYGLKQPREQIDKRLLNAIRNPHVDAIGHLTGRLVNTRPGVDLTFEDVLKAAADHGTLLEINAHPSRLDLDDIHAAAAKDRGIPIVSTPTLTAPPAST